jgi:transposase
MVKKGSNFQKHSPEFKVSVAEAYISGKYGGYIEVAKLFGLKSKTQVVVWTKRYRKEGPESLSQDRRTGGNNPLLGKHFREKDIEGWPLEQQIEYLKMENAILKKAKALRLKNSGEPSDT